MSAVPEATPAFLCAREEPYPAVRIERVWLVDTDVGAGLSGIIEADIPTCSSTANDVATAQVGTGHDGVDSPDRVIDRGCLGNKADGI